MRDPDSAVHDILVMTIALVGQYHRASTLG